MKVTSFTTALFAIGASAINHPDQPKGEAAVNVKTTDATVLIYANANATLTDPEIEVFVTGPGADPKSFNATQVNNIAVSVLEALDQVPDEPAAGAPAVRRRQEDSRPGAVSQAAPGEPKISVWVEEPEEGQTELEYDIFLSGPQVKAGEVTEEDYVDIALALLNLGEEVEGGKAPRPGPYVPGSSIGGFGGLKN